MRARTNQHDTASQVMVPAAGLDRHRYLAMQLLLKNLTRNKGISRLPCACTVQHLLVFKQGSRVIGLKVQAVRHLHTISGYSQFSLCRKNPHIVLPLHVCENKCAERKMQKVSRSATSSPALWGVGIPTFSPTWQWAISATVTGAWPTILMSLLIGSGRTKAR